MNLVQQIAPPQPVKLTVDQFAVLDEAGALDGYGKTELIEGVIYAMQAQHRPHTYAVSELAFRLRLRLQEVQPELLPLVEGTVELSQFSAPLPDIAVTSEPRGAGFIPLETMALVIEVADSSARHDLKTKAALYAQSAVPEYWILEIKKARLHQLWRPIQGAYQERRVIAVGEPITSITIPGLTVESDGLI